MKNKKHKKHIKEVEKISSKEKPLHLEQILDRIYNETNLATTCSHNLCCCKTGCPQMNNCEYISIISDIWTKISGEEKIELILRCLEYYFKNEYSKWGMETLIKKCPLLDEDKKLCKIYDRRPLSCRMYGLWPQSIYNSRVDKFEKAYARFNLKREEIPLNTQCPYVRRVDEKVPLTEELIEKLYQQLNDVDKKIGTFTDLQVKQHENYRTFHDWLLLNLYGEEGLSSLTTFILKADRATMENQIEILKEVVRSSFADKLDGLVKGMVEKAKV